MTYNSGHPWYYVLGGQIELPSEIRNAGLERGYKGYRESEIMLAAALPEPQRSAELRRIRTEVVDEYRRDVSQYRTCANDLRRYRRDANAVEPVCCDVHVSISLKNAHLYNDFAHLCLLDELLARQRDLFG